MESSEENNYSSSEEQDLSSNEMDVADVETAKQDFHSYSPQAPPSSSIPKAKRFHTTKIKSISRQPKKHRSQANSPTELIVSSLAKKKATTEKLEETAKKPFGIALVEGAPTFTFTAQNSLWRSCTADSKLDLVGDKEQIVDQLLNVDQYIVEAKLRTLKPDTYKEIKKLKVDTLLQAALSAKDSALAKEVSQAPDFIRKALNPKSTEYKKYFLPLGTSISKPFISDQRILQIQETGKLRHGDVIHVPFTAEEDSIVQSYLGSSSSVASIVEKLYWVLPGRTMNDIERFIYGKTYNIIENQTFTETRVITYQAPKAEAKMMTPQLLFTRQQSCKKNSAMMQRQIWKQYKVMGKHLTGPRVSTCRFHPTDYKVVAVSYADTESNVFPEAVIYDLKEKSFVHLKEGEEKPHKDCIPDAFFSHSGEYALTACFDSLIRVFSSNSGQLIHSFGKKTEDRKGHKEKIIVMCQPNTAKEDTTTDIVASVSEDRTAFVWNLESGSCLQSLDGNGRDPWRGGAITFQFGKGTLSNCIVSTTEGANKKSGEVIIWDYVNNNTLRRIVNDKLFGGDVFAAEISSVGNDLFIGANSVIALYDSRSQAEQRVTYIPQTDINQLVLSSCERYIASGGVDNRTFVFDTRYSAKPLHILSHDDDPTMKEEDVQGVTSVRWTRAGYLITGGDDGIVRVWDAKSGNNAVHSIKGHGASINYIDISTDEDYIISGADDNFVALYGISDKYNLFRDINKPDS